MTDLLKLSSEQRKTVFEQAAMKAGLPAKAIEKDWWVTLTLKALFTGAYSEYIIFKGGTSLSKCWNLIERFSEDIDISLDSKAFGVEYLESPSGGQIGNLRKKGCAFTTNVLKVDIQSQFEKLGIPLNTIKVEAAQIREKVPDTDPQTLYVNYESLFDRNQYLADQVKIEVSVKPLKEPKAVVKVQSILSVEFPNDAYSEEPFEVTAVEAHRTFMEKMFLLHEEFQKKDIDKIKKDRMSRHIYDLVRMMDAEPGKKALEDEELYTTIIRHRSNYNKMPQVDYATHEKAIISFIPPVGVMYAYENDYSKMRETMIYGEAPDFKSLITQLLELLSRLRTLSGKDIFQEQFEPIQGKYIRWWEDDKIKGNNRVFAKAAIEYISNNKLSINVLTFIQYSKNEYGIEYAKDRVENWEGEIIMETETTGTIVWKQTNPNNGSAGIKKIIISNDRNGITLVGEKNFGMEYFSERE